MASSHFPLDKTFLIATWLESLVYGFYLCLFSSSLFVSTTLRKSQNNHGRVMLYIGVVMFIIATVHLAMNLYRLIEGYVVHVYEPGGAQAYLGNLASWHHVFKDTLYATQEIFGDAVAIYRVWIIWNRDWRPIVLPVMLFIVSCISGYTVCGLYPTISPTAPVFSPVLARWIKTFFVVAVVQSSLTTGLMAYRIWMTNRRTSQFKIVTSNLKPVLKILLESASLQFFVELILLILYLAGHNAQYILLEIVTPTVGITFTAITIRIALRMAAQGYSDNNHVPSIHSLSLNTMQRMRSIAVNITQTKQSTFDQGTVSTGVDVESGQGKVEIYRPETGLASQPVLPS
ncbi:hypothetical protein BXZ70DRAFT_1009209 [Cristinia sonorae]|uniref:Uncharacterized protein n=1 Tax=Cristinia sonorae TaxID=1940300 RepID=A0A8K0ULI8_9AGAR|nr:hypothetical protein BXZ70DRAFT_1009209 [Cristinia sonorae]